MNAVIKLASKALVGAQDADVDLAQNTAAKVAADLHDLTGDPANPGTNKQLLYGAQKSALSLAYEARNAAVHAGREFCRLAIGVLKAEFGARWNTQWNLAGFVAPTLELPADPLNMLMQLRQYFHATPGKEVAVLQLTAAQAQIHLDAIQQGHSGVASARGELLLRKAARDRALKKLRKRLSGLRAELAQVLNADDGRWMAFGFRRPADGRKLEPVADITVLEGGDGVVVARWEPVSRADSYRVTCQSESGQESRIVTDTQCAFTGLPSGAVSISVAARNASGEAAAKQLIARPGSVEQIEAQGVATSVAQP